MCYLCPNATCWLCDSEGGTCGPCAQDQTEWANRYVLKSGEEDYWMFYVPPVVIGALLAVANEVFDGGL